MAREPRGVREYSTDEIVVEWQPRLCFHSHNCIRALPQVFDPDARPWVRLELASTDEVDAAVAQCPSGALRAHRVGAAEARTEPLEIEASANGPLLIRGGVRVLDGDGQRALRGRQGGALPLRRLGEQALLRRHAQDERLHGLMLDALPSGVVPVLLGRARGADRARDRLRRAAGRAVARAACRPARAVGQRPDPRARDRGRSFLPRHAGDLRLPAGARAVGARRRPPAPLPRPPRRARLRRARPAGRVLPREPRDRAAATSRRW